MTAPIAIAPVRSDIRVNADPARASMSSQRHEPLVAARAQSEQVIYPAIVMEPRTGGVWKERGEDGSECQWGKVLAWDPPARLVLAWQINAQWQYDPNLVTEVEVRFSPDGDGTVVELEHRLQGYGEAAEQMRQIFDGPTAWEGTLQHFAAEIG